MTNKPNLSTCNNIVDEVGQMNFSGNITPEIWYKTIINDKGKPHLLAITILSDIVYWYRPSEVRDESTGAVTYKKRFHANDFLQRSYAQLTDKFNISKAQARDAINLLESLGVIKKHLRNINTINGSLSNVMYLELIPKRLKELTYPNDTNNELSDSPKTNSSYFKNNDEVLQNFAPPTTSFINTYTETTTEGNTEIASTTIGAKAESVVDETLLNHVRKLFPAFSDKDILSLLKASDNDYEKIKNAKSILDNQTSTITNTVGWLINAIRGNYEVHTQSSNKRASKNTFNNFHQREYDYEELERFLLNSSVHS